jgi:hypothetical protein
MKNFNLDFLKDEVEVQYDEMVGLAAVDGHDGLIFNLKKLCEKEGFNLDGYGIVGFSFFDGEPIGQHELSVSILLIKKDEKPNGEGQQNIYKKHFSMSYQELGEYIKRLHVAVASKNMAQKMISNPIFRDLEE